MRYSGSKKDPKILLLQTSTIAAAPVLTVSDNSWIVHGEDDTVITCTYDVKNGDVPTVTWYTLFFIYHKTFLFMIPSICI